MGDVTKLKLDSPKPLEKLVGQITIRMAGSGPVVDEAEGPDVAFPVIEILVITQPAAAYLGSIVSRGTPISPVVVSVLVVVGDVDGVTEVREASDDIAG
ncbi:hypothetical protein SLS58_007401 [Diplodia intermedia]|uniref:Uncharacterized protein n=1 Tax=Diplodia intermedia TaxID=856260 RepID=A0ABR3TL67_9PEZI